MLNQKQPGLSLHCLLERLLKHFSRRQKQSIIFVIGALMGNRAKQLNRRRHIRLVCLVNVRGRLVSNMLTDTLVYTIAHWSGPPRSYVDFSQEQQGRLVYVRTAVAATCIKI